MLVRTPAPRNPELIRVPRFLQTQRDERDRQRAANERASGRKQGEPTEWLFVACRNHVSQPTTWCWFEVEDFFTS